MGAGAGTGVEANGGRPAGRASDEADDLQLLQSLHHGEAAHLGRSDQDLAAWGAATRIRVLMVVVPERPEDGIGIGRLGLSVARLHHRGEREEPKTQGESVARRGVAQPKRAIRHPSRRSRPPTGAASVSRNPKPERTL